MCHSADIDLGRLAWDRVIQISHISCLRLSWSLPNTEITPVNTLPYSAFTSAAAMVPMLPNFENSMACDCVSCRIHQRQNWQWQQNCSASGQSLTNWTHSHCDWVSQANQIKCRARGNGMQFQWQWPIRWRWCWQIEQLYHVCNVHVSQIKNRSSFHDARFERRPIPPSPPWQPPTSAALSRQVAWTWSCADCARVAINVKLYGRSTC